MDRVDSIRIAVDQARELHLGRTQARALERLLRYGEWPGEWNLDTAHHTATTLDSMVKYGIVEREDNTRRSYGRQHPTYRPAAHLTAIYRPPSDKDDLE